MKKFQRGAVLNLNAAWRLAQAVFPDRLKVEWQPKTAAEMEEVYRRLGLTDPFWRSCPIP